MYHACVSLTLFWLTILLFFLLFNETLPIINKQKDPKKGGIQGTKWKDPRPRRQKKKNHLRGQTTRGTSSSRHTQEQTQHQHKLLPIPNVLSLSHHFWGLIMFYFWANWNQLKFHGKRPKKMRDQKKRKKDKKKTHLIPYSLMVGKLRPMLGTYLVGLRSSNWRFWFWLVKTNWELDLIFGIGSRTRNDIFEESFEK